MVFSNVRKSALPYDIFSAAFYLITRYEEYLPYIPDEFGSFPVEQSVAFKNKFLEQPIIDHWADIFLNTLLVSFPNLNFKGRSCRVNTLIQAKQPFAYANQALVNIIFGYIKEIGQWKIKDAISRSQTLLGLKPDPYDTFSWIIQNTRMASKKYSFLCWAMLIKYQKKIQIAQKCIKDKVCWNYERIGIVF